VPEIQEENLMKKPQELQTLSNYLMILKVTIKYLGKCLQKNLSLIERQNLNLFLLINPLLLLPHKCLYQIPKLIDSLHPSRDPSPPLRYLIILQPLKIYNRKMFSYCSNRKRGRPWIGISTMTMQYYKKR
jgi:hypothetical protein